MVATLYMTTVNACFTELMCSDTLLHITAIFHENIDLPELIIKYTRTEIPVTDPMDPYKSIAITSFCCCVSIATQASQIYWCTSVNTFCIVMANDCWFTQYVNIR